MLGFFFSHGVLMFLHLHISSYNMMKLFYSKIVSEATPGWLWYAWGLLSGSSRDGSGSSCKELLVNNGSFVHEVTVLLMFRCSLCYLVLPQAGLVAVSSVISGLNFDAEESEQGSRNPRNLTKCKLFTKTTYTVWKEGQRGILILPINISMTNLSALS